MELQPQRPLQLQEPQESPRWITSVAVAAIVVGGAVRVWALTQRGSLWLDEASLALNVLGREFAALATPLDWGQAAPVGFLWVLKAITTVIGHAEWQLRLWPFVAGVLVLPLTWLIGRRLVGAAGAMLATVAMACSLLAIRYSAEAKPYASDAFVALALVWLATEVLAHPANRHRWLTLGIAGVAAVTLSLPSAFVLGAIGIALARAAWTNGTRARAALALCAGAWLATFGAIWLIVVRDAAAGAYLKEYWAPVMLDPTAPDFVARLVRMAASVAATPLRWSGSLETALGAVVVTACGVFAVARRNPSGAVLLAGPAALGAAASLLGYYPMSDRLAFFAAPLVVLAAGRCVAGAAGMLSRPAGPRVSSAILGTLAALIAFWVGSDAWRMVRAPGSLEPTRRLFHLVREEASVEQAPVYVYARAAPAWLYATMDWSAPDTARYEFYRRTTGDTRHEAHENFAHTGAATPVDPDKLVVPAAPLMEIVGLAPGVRYRIAGPTSRDGPFPGWAEQEARRIRTIARPVAWVVASHFFEGTARDELRPLVEALGGAGLVIVEQRRSGRDVVALRVVAR